MEERAAETPRNEGGPGLPRAGKEAGRTRCAVCGVKLSIYNRGPHCWNHTMGRPWRGPSAKPRFD